MDFFKDTWNAVAALSRLGRSQLVLVLVGSVVNTVLAGICTAWGGSAFFATIAFLICDVVNAMYSITYENSFAFTSLAVLLVEQNVVLTAGTAVGIMDDGESWVPKSLKWVAVGFGWCVLAVLLLTQLALRKDWGWHAHKLGLARTEDVALYQRLLQLEGAILLDFCQVIPCCVVLIGKYGFSSNVAEHVGGSNTHEDRKLQHVVSILFFVAAILSVVCAPVLGSSARRENPTPFGIAGFVTMCTSGMIIFGTVDVMRRIGWPPHASDAILFSLVILTCLVRTILIIAILRIPTAVFGSGIASRLNRGSGGILLPSNIEGWSECRRSAFGGRSTAADTDGAAMLYGNIEDYSDTESDVGAGNYSNPNLVYGERVKIRESVLSRHSGTTSGSPQKQQQQRNNSDSHNQYGGTTTNNNSHYPSMLSQQSNVSSSAASPPSHHPHHHHHHRRQDSNSNSMKNLAPHHNDFPKNVMTGNQNTTPLLSSVNVVDDEDDYDGQHTNSTSLNNPDNDQDSDSYYNQSSTNTSKRDHHSLGQLSRYTSGSQNNNRRNQHPHQHDSSRLDDNETSSNTSRPTSHHNSRTKSPNTIFVKASVGKKPPQ